MAMDAAAAAEVEYGSVADLVPQLLDRLQLHVPPASVFSSDRDLPPWLRLVPEHQLRPVDAAALAAFTGLPVQLHLRSYWVKASTVQGLRDAVAGAPALVRADLAASVPLCVYLMPTAPLEDAHHVSNITMGTEQLQEDVQQEQVVEQPVICVVHNVADLQAKVSAFQATVGVRKQIGQAREALANQTAVLAARAQADVLRAQEMRALYEDAKAEFLDAKEVAPPEADGSPAALWPERMRMMMTFSHLLVAQEIAQVSTGAAASLEALGDLLAQKDAQVEDATRRLTFMGCAPPAVAADAHGGGGGHGNA